MGRLSLDSSVCSHHRKMACVEITVGLVYSAARCPEIMVCPVLPGTCVKRFKTIIYCGYILSTISMRIDVMTYSKCINSSIF